MFGVLGKPLGRQRIQGLQAGEHIVEINKHRSPDAGTAGGGECLVHWLSVPASRGAGTPSGCDTQADDGG